jgi:glycosyltransferase involved in cell wall biosynthesis
MEEIVLSTGIQANKVFRIPVGINLTYFSYKTAVLQETARKDLGIPQSAIVIGSFQKDGVGWGEGMQPKLIKGPDIFLKTIALLRTRIPELFVLLSGPARGYVKHGLEQLKIPYYHIYTKNYSDIGNLYQAIDLYLITSRQEGGPKALLESMASGVPLITTRVGQAMDLVNHGENAWMVEVEDIEGLAYWADYVINHRDDISDVLQSARRTAEENAYDSLIPLWQEFMDGYVEWGNK